MIGDIEYKWSENVIFFQNKWGLPSGYRGGAFGLKSSGKAEIYRSPLVVSIGYGGSPTP